MVEPEYMQESNPDELTNCRGVLCHNMEEIMDTDMMVSWRARTVIIEKPLPLLLLKR
jgi:hypothetical protein